MGKTWRPSAKWVVTMWLVYSVAPAAVGGRGWDDEEDERVYMASTKAEVLKQTNSEAMKDVAAVASPEEGNLSYLNPKNIREQRLINKAVDGAASETIETSSPAASGSDMLSQYASYDGAGKLNYEYEEWNDLEKKEIATHGYDTLKAYNEAKDKEGEAFVSAQEEKSDKAKVTYEEAKEKVSQAAAELGAKMREDNAEL